MFLRERISRYSLEVSGAGLAKIGLETAHYARTRRYAARWSRWKTVGQFSASASATRRIAFFQEAEQNLYSTTVTCYRDRRRTCNRDYARTRGAKIPSHWLSLHALVLKRHLIRFLLFQWRIQSVKWKNSNSYFKFHFSVRQLTLNTENWLRILRLRRKIWKFM